MKFFLSPILHLALIVALVVYCFGRTLTGYFLADDPAQVAYVNVTVTSEPIRIWQNMTGNYMQIPGMNVWRPTLFVSMVCDYLFWGVNACGFYFTNLAYFTGCAGLFYVLIRQLTDPWGRMRSASTALFSTFWFVASPLRCESVSWVVGRVDIISCFFYLVGFNLLVFSRKKASKLVTSGIVAAFWLAIWAKEMAIGLPVLAFVIGFLFETRTEAASRSIGKRLCDGVSLALPLLISMVLYFVFRYLALGTLVGGYTGGFGASQSAAMLTRWFDGDILLRLVLPFNYSLYGKTPIEAQIVWLCGLFLLALFVIRLLCWLCRQTDRSLESPANSDQRQPFKLALLILVWAATACLPIYQLWGLGAQLEGSRFYWFLSLPLSLVLPVLLLMPLPGLASASVLARVDNRLCLIASLVMSLAVCVMARTTLTTDLLWVNAGKQVRMLKDQSIALAASDKDRESRFVILGIPKSNNGAHMLLNGHEFNALLSPPFTKENVASRFVTLDPTMFGQAELINATRLKDLLAKGNVKGPYVWTGRSLEPVELLAVNKEPPSTIEILKPDGQLDWQPYVSGRQVWLSQNGILSIGANTGGDGLRFLDIDINPLEIDFLEFDFASSKIGGKNAVDVFFSGKTTLPDHMSAISENRATIELKDTAENEFQKVRVRLSQCWRWFCFSRINQIALGLPHAEDVRIRNLRLVSAARLTPSIDSGIEVSSTGDRLVSNTPVTLRLKSRVEDAVSVRVEVGQRNFFFDNFANADMPDVRTLIVKAPEAVVDLEPALLNEVGYYQVRAIGIDKDGATIGEYSDSLTFYIQNPQ